MARHRGHSPEFHAEQFLYGCRGKVRHTSKRLATGVLRVMRRAPETIDGHRLQVYHCASCHYWHVGKARIA